MRPRRTSFPGALQQAICGFSFGGSYTSSQGELVDLDQDGGADFVDLSNSFVAPFPVFGPPTAGRGRGGLTVTLPPSIWPGTTAFVQAGILDPGSVLGFAGTNAFALVIQ